MSSLVGTKSIDEFLRDWREHGLDDISPEDITSSDWTSTDTIGIDGWGSSVGVCGCIDRRLELSSVEACWYLSTTVSSGS